MKKNLLITSVFIAIYNMTYAQIIYSNTSKWVGFSDFKMDIGASAGQNKSLNVFVEPRIRIIEDFEVGLRYGIYSSTSSNPNDMVLSRGLQLTFEYIKSTADTKGSVRPFFGMGVGQITNVMIKDGYTDPNAKVTWSDMTGPDSFKSWLITPRFGIDVAHIRLMIEAQIPLKNDFSKTSIVGTLALHLWGGANQSYSYTRTTY